LSPTNQLRPGAGSKNRPLVSSTMTDPMYLRSNRFLTRTNSISARAPDVLRETDAGIEDGIGRRGEYENEMLPLFVREMHKRLEKFYGQLPFTLLVKNIGEVRADNVIIDVNEIPVLQPDTDRIRIWSVAKL
jgi:hypothetical protein